MKVEEKYLDVLQNIEFAIVNVYRVDSSLLDIDARDAIEALTRQYWAEERQHQQRPALRLSDRAERVFNAVQATCEWRLGRQPGPSQAGQPLDLDPSPIGLGEMILCLKRIDKSIRRWTKQGGRQGYLNFVKQFTP